MCIDQTLWAYSENADVSNICMALSLSLSLTLYFISQRDEYMHGIEFMLSVKILHNNLLSI